MDNEADKVIDPIVIAEGVVIAFVAHDPGTGEDAALYCNVSCPAQVVERAGKILVYISGGNVVQSVGHEEVLNEVAERSDERFFEAMGGNGFLEITYGEGRFLMRSASKGFCLGLLAARSCHSAACTHYEEALWRILLNPLGFCCVLLL